MTTTEFNLSEKMVFKGIDDNFHYDKYINDCIKIKDVKEFIRLLKEEFNKFTSVKGWDGKNKAYVLAWIDKLAGDKLK